jgi:diguanylate cyclase (GGDEF)-like protein
MKHNRLYINIAALGIWLILAAAALIWTDPTMGILALVTLIITATLGLTDRIKNAGWIAAVLSILVNGAVQFSMAGFYPSNWLGFGIIAAAFCGTALLSSRTNHQMQIVLGQLDRDQKLIEELQVNDPETGLLKWIYAQKTLKTEITRSQRFHNDLCLMLIQVEHWDQPGDSFTAGSRKELKTQMASIISNTLRSIDTSFSSGKVGAILPGTRPEGAIIAAERLVKNSIRKAHVAVYVGISHFPNDGVTEEEIVNAAETALLVAVNNDRSIVQFGQTSYTLAREDLPSQQPLDETIQNNPDDTKTGGNP